MIIKKNKAKYLQKGSKKKKKHNMETIEKRIKEGKKAY